jgi:glutamate synthase (NADPH/NADH) small chain
VNEETGETSKDRVYAAGDIVTGSATVIEAAGGGKLCATAIHKRLSGE